MLYLKSFESNSIRWPVRPQIDEKRPAEARAPIRHFGEFASKRCVRSARTQKSKCRAVRRPSIRPTLIEIPAKLRRLIGWECTWNNLADVPHWWRNPKTNAVQKVYDDTATSLHVINWNPLRHKKRQRRPLFSASSLAYRLLRSSFLSTSFELILTKITKKNHGLRVQEICKWAESINGFKIFF